VSLEGQLAAERMGRDRAEQKIKAVEEHVAMLAHASKQQSKALHRERELLMQQVVEEEVGAAQVRLTRREGFANHARALESERGGLRKRAGGAREL
jgi:hypothetical protein